MSLNVDRNGPDNNGADGSWASWILPFAVLLFAVVFSVIPVFSTEFQEAGEPVVVVYPPWATSVESLSSLAGADVPIAGPGKFDWIFIAVPEGPEDIRKLRQSGAVAVLNGSAVRFCAGNIFETAGLEGV